MSRRRIEIFVDDQTKKDFGLQLHILRFKRHKSQSVWAEEIGVDPSMLSRLEDAKSKTLPKRHVVIDWGNGWGLDWDERAELLLSAKYLPELPSGFGAHGTPDRAYLRGALRELQGLEDMGYCKVLRVRISQLSNASL